MMKLLPWFSRILLAFGLGALMTLSFAPYDYYWLAPLSLALWIACFDDETPKRGSWIGLAFGVGFFSFGLWWIRISLNEFGGAPILFAIVATLLLSLYLGLYYLLIAYFTLKTHRNIGYRYGFLFPILGVAFEVMRSLLFTGFPWLALGYTMIDTFMAKWSYTAMGALISSFWVYWAGGMLFILIKTIFTFTKNKRWFYQFITPVIFILSIVGVVAGSHYYLSDDIVDFQPPVKTVLLQGNISQNDKFIHFDQNIEAYLDMTRIALENNDVVIWPETALAVQYSSGLELNNGFKIEELNELASKAKSDIVVGIFGGDANIGEVTNAVALFNAQEPNQFYHKHHLLPFGEYIPFRKVFNFFSRWVNIPYGDLMAGERYQKPFHFLSTKARAGVSVCFEAVFGDELRYQAKISEFLINVSNDAWFGNSNGPWQHLQISRARSIELARPMLRATNTGITAFIDAEGEVIAKADQFVVAQLKGSIQPQKGLTSYVKTGDYLWIALFLFLLFLAALSELFSPWKRA